MSRPWQTTSSPLQATLMPNSHVPWAMCDKLVYACPYDFQASQLATGYGVCVHIVYEHRAISCMSSWPQTGQSRMKAVRRSYGNRAMPVRSPQIPHGNRTTLERARGDGVLTVRGPYDCINSPRFRYHPFTLGLGFLHRKK